MMIFHTYTMLWNLCEERFPDQRIRNVLLKVIKINSFQAIFNLFPSQDN